MFIFDISFYMGICNGAAARYHSGNAFHGENKHTRQHSYEHTVYLHTNTTRRFPRD